MRHQFIIIIFTLFAAVQVADAQDSHFVKATVSKNKLLLGEPVTLTVQALVPDSSAARFTGQLTFDHFEALKDPEITTGETKSGTEIKAIYTITSFDSGHWVIPPISIAPLQSDSIAMDVVFTSPFDSTQAYHDIKDVVDVKVPKKKNDWWYYAAAGAVLLALVTWQLLRKKQTPPPATPPAVPGINPYDEAMQMLDQLMADKPAVKQFYSRLTEIFRLYVFRKKGILSLQKTTDDLVLQVKPLVPEKEQFDRLSQTLRLADFVKFARYIPGEEDNHTSLTEIRKTITLIEKAAAKQAHE